MHVVISPWVCMWFCSLWAWCNKYFNSG